MPEQRKLEKWAIFCKNLKTNITLKLDLAKMDNKWTIMEKIRDQGQSDFRIVFSVILCDPKFMEIVFTN